MKNIFKTITWAVRHPIFAFFWWKNHRPYSDRHLGKLTAILFFAMAFSAMAQTNTNAPQNFLSTIQGYFSHFDPTLTNTFSDSKRLDLWTGAEQNLGNNTAADLGIEFRAYTFSETVLSISLESVTKNAGIAGTILGTQAGVGLNYVYIDTKLTGYVDGGYDFLNERPYAEIGLRVKKALTVNTFAGIGIALPIEKGFTGRPNIVIFTGFTF